MKDALLFTAADLRRGDARFTLTFTARKPLVRFGDGGYSRKGAAPTAASYYLTFPRLRIAGELALGDSVAINGCCLTVADLAPGGTSFDLLAQTLRVTSLGGLIVSHPSPTGPLQGYHWLGWIAAGCGLVSLWLARRVKEVA